MRRLRQLPPDQRDDFELNEQATIRQQLDPIKNGIALAGLFITGLALFVGAIGIMNITYVSVKERTKEIGTRKALGARRRTILLQFLIEAVVLCLVGGALGIAAGLGALGQGKAIGSAAEAIARNPSASGEIRGVLILGLVLIESLSIYVLLISLILFFLQPFKG